MKKRVVVTQRDIDKGEPVSAFRCPVARAMTRAFRTPVSVSGDRFWIDVNYPTAYDLPDRAVGWIDGFDQTHYSEDRSGIRPIRFTVEVPD